MRAIYFKNSHGNYIVDRGKSWKNHGIVFLNFCGNPVSTITGFYTKLNVWGSLGLNFVYDGGPIFLYKRRILEGSTSFCEGIRTGLSCQTGVAKHQVIFVSQPFVATKPVR